MQPTPRTGIRLGLRRTALIIGALVVSPVSAHASDGGTTEGHRWRLPPIPEETCGDFPECFLLPAVVVSANEAWAFGHRLKKSQRPNVVEGLALRWDGKTWSQVVVAGKLIQAATATTPTNLWFGRADRLAAGWQCDDNGPADRWDGDAWHKTGDPVGGCMAVIGIKAFAPDDVWSIGIDESKMDSPFGTPLIAHWDGRAWTVVPQPPDVGLLLAIDGVAANDIWIIGTTPPADTGAPLDPLALHWDGKEWSRFSLPKVVEDGSVSLSSVRAFSSSDVWAVGNSGDNRPFVARWNGQDWARVVVPSGGVLMDIGRGGSELVAVGYSRRTPEVPFVLRYDGKAFVKVPGPTTTGMLDSIASIDGTGRFWVTGSTWGTEADGGPSGKSKAMIAEYVPPPGGDEDVPPPSDGGGGTSPESGPDVPDDTPEPAKAESDGCGCAVPGPPTSLPAPFALVGAAYLLRRGVRRIRQRPQR